MPSSSSSQEKTLDWVLKATTALIIPALVWSFKLSTEVAVLEERLASQEKHLEEMKSDLKERIKTANDKLDKIIDRLSH